MFRQGGNRNKHRRGLPAAVDGSEDAPNGHQSQRHGRVGNRGHHEDFGRSVSQPVDHPARFGKKFAAHILFTYLTHAPLSCVAQALTMLLIPPDHVCCVGSVASRCKLSAKVKAYNMLRSRKLCGPTNDWKNILVVGALSSALYWTPVDTLRQTSGAAAEVTQERGQHNSKLHYTEYVSQAHSKNVFLDRPLSLCLPHMPPFPHHFICCGVEFLTKRIEERDRFEEDETGKVEPPLPRGLVIDGPALLEAMKTSESQCALLRAAQVSRGWHQRTTSWCDWYFLFAHIV